MVLADVMVPHLTRQSLPPNKTVQTCQSKTIKNETILHFWQQFLHPSLPWHTDLTQFKGNLRQRQHLRCILYSPSWGIGWWSKKTIKYYATKRHLYQYWPGSFIQEWIIMVTCQSKTIKNETILHFWQQFLHPSLPWHTDLTQFKGNLRQRQHLRCILYSPSWGIGWWSKKTIKYYATKRHLYQYWPGSFIQEWIIMVKPTRNGTFLN